MIFEELVGDVTSPTVGIIGHGVNCQGVMGSGVARCVRDKFPKAYEEYVALCGRYEPRDLLGRTQLVNVADDLYVANMFTQLSFGGDGKVYACTEAVEYAVEALVKAIARLELDPATPIHLPLIGCGLGGLNWSQVRPIIDKYTGDKPVTIYHYSK